MKAFTYIVLLACLAMSANAQATAVAECSIDVMPMNAEAQAQEIFYVSSDDSLFKPKMQPYSANSGFVTYDFDLSLSVNRVYENSFFTFRQTGKKQFVNFTVHPRLLSPATLNADGNETEVWAIHFETRISSEDKQVLNQSFDMLVTNDSLKSAWRYYDRTGISNFGTITANCSLKK